MNKRLSRLITALVIVLVGGILYLVGYSIWEQNRREILQRGLRAMLPGVTQHLQKFRRVKMEHGRKVWEVAAEDARYYEQENVIVVRKPRVAWFLEDGREIGMEGELGRIRMQDNEVAQVEFDGDIEVSLAAYRIRTADAVYDHASGTITTAGAVEISGEAIDLRGDGMAVDVRSQRLELLSNVSMHLEQAYERRGG